MPTIKWETARTKLLQAPLTSLLLTFLAGNQSRSKQPSLYYYSRHSPAWPPVPCRSSSLPEPAIWRHLSASPSFWTGLHRSHTGMKTEIQCWMKRISIQHQLCVTRHCWSRTSLGQRCPWEELYEGHWTWAPWAYHHPPPQSQLQACFSFSQVLSWQAVPSWVSTFFSCRPCQRILFLKQFKFDKISLAFINGCSAEIYHQIVF